MSVIQNNLLMTPEGYQISRSVRLRSSASAYFNRTFGTPTDNKKWTYSAWLKLGSLTTNQRIFSAGTNASGWDQAVIQLYANAGSMQLEAYQSQSGSAATEFDVMGSAQYRDPSAWYHIVAAYDSANATSTDRVQLYVNGTRISSFSASTFPSSSLASRLNAARSHDIGRYGAGSTYMDGYLTEVNFIDGQALTPSSFGETDAVTGVWKPKKYAGTYGTNGFYLNFSDNSAATAAAIGKDSSGNGNNWTPNNISVTAGVTYDSMLDVPTLWADGGNGRGNYCVLNGANNGYGTATLTQGNLYAVLSAPGATEGSAIGSIGMSTGKWYWEVNVVSANTTYGYPCSIGIGNQSSTNGVGTPNASYTYNSKDGNKMSNTGSFVSAAYGASFTANDVIGVAFDADAGTLTFYKNNTSQGVAFTGIASSTWFARVGSNDGCTVAANFGQRPFTYTPPTGFKALNTQNLPDATIKKGNQYFDATTYTGNGSSQSIVNSGAMQPDFVWLKSRSSGSYAHVLYDSVRGATKRLFSNLTNAEDTASTGLTAFDSSGFSLGSQTTTNDLSATYVGWQWKESVSAGFDIVTYTGNGTTQGVAHSLGVAPKMMIMKDRTSGSRTADQWPVYHASAQISGADQILYLNSTAARATASTVFNNTVPTSTQFSVGTWGGINYSGDNYVAYLFAEVAGFSKFGSYTGNGSADGPFVYLGFRPKFVITKSADSTAGVGDWTTHDTSRLTYNTNDLRLFANASSAESSSEAMDMLSNGFKIRATNSNCNTSGGGYIYMAFAENPFKNSLAR